MSSEIIQSISQQTGETDLLYIERVYYECQQNHIDTILKILKVNVPPSPAVKKHPTLFDDMRTICDAKDTVFQSIFMKLKST
jgi:hypothetical protein